MKQWYLAGADYERRGYFASVTDVYREANTVQAAWDYGDHWVKKLSSMIWRAAKKAEESGDLATAAKAYDEIVKHGPEHATANAKAHSVRIRAAIKESRNLTERERMKSRHTVQFDDNGDRFEFESANVRAEGAGGAPVRAEPKE